MEKIAGKYKIVETIAAGGMATIYKGVQISLNREVVIKKLHPYLAKDANFVKRFKREAAILANLQHKNIVSIIDFFEENNNQYIVLEYIKGITLEELIKKKKRINLKYALYILKEVSQGLAYIHDNNILHRDLKPDNIMISEKGEIKITDFGLAYRTEAMKITNPGTYLGTPSYFPPEQLMGKPLKPASDIFSLGITFIEMITGKNPFLGKEEFETINNILYHKTINLNFKKGQFSQEIINLIYAMLERNVDNRIQSAYQIENTINKININISQKQFLKYINDNKTIEDEFNLEVIIVKREPLYKIVTLSVLIIVFLTIIIFQIVNLIVEPTTKTVYIKTPPPPKHTLFIKTNNNVNITINDSLIIKSNQSVKLPSGKYYLKVNNEEYEQFDTIIDLNKNDTIDIYLKKKIFIKEYGYIQVNAIPWADVYIDNTLVDRTPLNESLKLEIGKHELKLIHPNRKPFIDTILIKKDSTVMINKELEKVYGYLKIIVRPWADIYIDDSLIGTTPIGDSIELLTGPHSVVLKNPNYDDINDVIIIKEKEVLRKAYSF